MIDTPPRPDEIVWLPDDPTGFRYVADPFAIVRDHRLTVFVEAFDYRDRRGEIHYFQYDADDRLIDQGLALAEPFHLSYPGLVVDGDELFMLPEGHKSGALHLYRCIRFPDRWERLPEPVLRAPAIDASVVRHGDRWWMFYALPGPGDRAMRELHVAHAEVLTGPWIQHAANPVARGFAQGRPGGTAFEIDGRLHLPIQDCSSTYGAAIDLLRIDTLTPDVFGATVIRRFEPGHLLAGYGNGLHTLSGDDTVTCIDVKSIRTSPAEGWIKAQYKVRRLLGLTRPRRRPVTDAATPRPQRAAPARSMGLS
ncbi:hypothetical protein [Brevundimonas subvibrioides]|uniref:glucosamine inositolphosphorylceramide transferase family protein n=1 Tax=Brevundimonas subvibrioides TaxID=74313 RepID=UPI0022B31455|nr:hypothetical protein [Brevundimonas subvibrioides]